MLSTVTQGPGSGSQTSGKKRATLPGTCHGFLVLTCSNYSLCRPSIMWTLRASLMGYIHPHIHPLTHSSTYAPTTHCLATVHYYNPSIHTLSIHLSIHCPSICPYTVHLSTQSNVHPPMQSISHSSIHILSIPLSIYCPLICPYTVLPFTQVHPSVIHCSSIYPIHCLPTHLHCHHPTHSHIHLSIHIYHSSSATTIHPFILSCTHCTPIHLLTLPLSNTIHPSVYPTLPSVNPSRHHPSSFCVVIYLLAYLQRHLPTHLITHLLTHSSASLSISALSDSWL